MELHNSFVLTDDDDKESPNENDTESDYEVDVKHHMKESKI